MPDAAESKKEKTPEEVAEAEKQLEGEKNVRVGKTLKIDAYADFAKKPIDIIVLGDSHNFSSTFIPIHAKSSDKAKDVFNNVLANAKDGNIIGGDFNVNFLDPKVQAIEELEKALKARGLCMDITPEAIAQLKILFKTRSVSSLFSQQLFKNGEPDCALKDLPAFKLRKRKGDEAVLPLKFKEKIAELSAQRDDFMDKVKEEIAAGTFTELSATKLSKNYKDMVSFHDLDASKGHDHQYLESYDKESDTLFIMQNSVKQEPYNFDAHFNKKLFDFDKPEEVEKVKELYSDLDDVVFKEMYKLLLKKDGKTDADLDKRTREEIKILTSERIKDPKKDVKIDNLKKEDLTEYYTNVLQSKALLEINKILKVPYSEDALKEKLKKITEGKTSNLTSAASSVYQALSSARPKEYDDPKYEQSIGLIGNGFLPYVNDKNEIISATKIEEIQVKDIINNIEKAHALHPTAEVVFAFIEGDSKQADKIDQIKAKVDQLNLQVLKNRDNVLSECLKNPEQKDMRNLYNSIEEMKKGGQNLKSDPDGKRMIDLSEKLHANLNQFIWAHMKLGTCSDEQVNQFKKDFETLIHSEDKNIKHQALWKPIVANIVIALFTAGIAIAIKAIHNHYVAAKEDRKASLEQSFFFTQTQSQKDVSKVHSMAFKGLTKELRQEGKKDVNEENDQDKSGPDTGSAQP